MYPILSCVPMSEKSADGQRDDVTVLRRKQLTSCLRKPFADFSLVALIEENRRSTLDEVNSNM